MNTNPIPHWAGKYIGLPFELGARGPDKFDCWGLVVEVFKQEKGIQLPEFSDVAGAMQLSQHGDLIRSELALRWQEIDKPEEFALALIGTNAEAFYHIGVWTVVNNACFLLHTRARANAVLETPNALRLRGLALRKQYRLKGN